VTKPTLKRSYFKDNPLGHCSKCHTVLMTCAELSELTGVPHSTVALRLRRSGLVPAAREGERELYVPGVVLRCVLGRE
jgi:hypothetical protein